MLMAPHLLACLFDSRSQLYCSYTLQTMGKCASLGIERASLGIERASLGIERASFKDLDDLG